MTQQVINIGSAPNDGTGDPLRTAFEKSNDNFTELYGVTDASVPEAPADGLIYGRSNEQWVDIGAPGGGSGTAEFAFNATTTAPPAAGQVRLDNADQDSATKVYISGMTAPGADIYNYLMNLLTTSSRVYIQDKDNSSNYRTYQVTGAPVGNTTWVEVPVSLYGGAGTLPAQRVLLTIIQPPTDLSAYAPLASPTFTGDPKAPTPSPGDNDTSIATTAFVATAISGKADTSALSAYALLASPTFTGDPKAPTPATSDNDTSIATTAFTQAAIAAIFTTAHAWTAAQTFINSSGIKIQDTNASHTLGLIVGSDLTADRTLTITTGDASRTISLSGNLTLANNLTTSGNFAATFTFTNTTTVTFPTTGTLATTDASSLTSGTLPDARLSSAATPYGKQKISLAVDYWKGATTNGPEFNSIAGSNNERRYAAFDASTQETMYAFVSMPPQWNESTFTFEVEWEHPATTTNFGVAFDLAAVAIGDNEAGDPAFGTAIVVTDTGGTTNNNYKTAESSAVTAAGTIAAGDLLMLRFRRAPANASDTMAVDARVKSVNLFPVTDAGHD